jgi:23S rRNA (cytidine1920-2'-O)/16S rRNA (cytidine1409-2'-O)-methyltransferase
MAEKPGQLLDGAVPIEVADETPQYVSFGGDKLAAALDAFGPAFDPAGRVCLDIGASTGGFTDVLLRRGAAKVYSVDVGTLQLAAALRNDCRVVVLEGVDARLLTAELVPEPVQAIVADVSFVSLTKVLRPALRLAAPGAVLIALVKPQFEAGPDAIGRGGIVRDPADRERALAAVRAWLAAIPGWRLGDTVTAPGLTDANVEFLIGARRDD